MLDKTRKRIRAGIISAGAVAGALLSIWALFSLITAELDERIDVAVAAALDEGLEQKLGPALEAELPAIVSAATARFLVCDDVRRQEAFARGITVKPDSTQIEIAEARASLESLANVSSSLGCDVDLAGGD